MSIFSILNKPSESTIISGVRSVLPKAVRQDVTDLASKAGSIRNALGLGSRVPKNEHPEFDIDRFTGELSKSGLSHNNRFTVDLLPPEGIVTEKIHERLKLRCFASSLPGKTLMIKDDIRRHGYGMIDKVPHNTLYTDVNLAFIIDTYGEVPTLFHRWLDFIHSADPVPAEEVVSQGDFTTDYLVRYKQEYAAPLTIRQLTTNYNRAYGVRLREAYPIAIGDQQLTWDNNNTIAILPVTFTYVDFQLI